MPQAVFDRLPVELTDDEVPVGWHLAPLSQLMELLGGGTPKRKVPAYWNGEIPWFSVRDAPADANIWVIETAEHITQAGVDNSSAKVVRKGTTIISARGTVGRLALTGVPMALNQSCYGIQGADGVGDYFTYFTLHYAVEDLRHRTHGSVFDTITRQTFDSLVRVRPSQDVLDAFEGVVAPFMELIRHNLFENRTLRLMRDVLLPNLTSGKVRVPTPGANRG
jgi:type I restriction enzyme S subunit